jgi:hypothetical protein
MRRTNDKIAVKGQWGEVVYASRLDGSRPAEEFYLALSVADQAKVNGLLKQMADHGKIVNREKFRQVEGSIFEFKSFQIRISCYRDRSCWYLLHGFLKKKNRWPSSEVIRAENLHKQHIGT